MADKHEGENEVRGDREGAGDSVSPDLVLCEVFRSPRREGMYLYVERGEGLARVPGELLKVFGAPQSALVFRLHAGRRMARVSAQAVLQGLVEQGFYVQMPPASGSELDGDGGGEQACAGGGRGPQEHPGGIPDAD